MRGHDDGAMEFEVGHAARIGLVDGLPDFRQCTLQPFEIGNVGALAGEADRLAFDRDARLHDVVKHVRLVGEGEGEEVVQYRDVRPGHHSTDAVADLDDAEHRQGTQRLANDRPANA